MIHRTKLEWRGEPAPPEEQTIAETIETGLNRVTERKVIPGNRIVAYSQGRPKPLLLPHAMIHETLRTYGPFPGDHPHYGTLLAVRGL